MGKGQSASSLQHQFTFNFLFKNGKEPGSFSTAAGHHHQGEATALFFAPGIYIRQTFNPFNISRHFHAYGLKIPGGHRPVAMFNSMGNPVNRFTDVLPVTTADCGLRIKNPIYVCHGDLKLVDGTDR